MANGRTLPPGFEIVEEPRLPPGSQVVEAPARQLPEGFSTVSKEQILPAGFSIISRPVEESPSELFKVFAGGIRDAVQSLGQLVDPVAQRLEEAIPLGSIRFGGEDFIQFAPGFQPTDLPEVEEPETTIGRIGRPIVQFAAPAGIATKGALGLTGARTAAGRLLTTEAAAVATGQAVFDPFEKRLSNIIQETPSLANPVAEFLAADPADSEAEARLKMAMEDAGLGLALGGVLEGVRGLRRLRTQKGVNPPVNSPEIPKEAAKAQESVIDLSTNIERAKGLGKVPRPTPTEEVLPPNLNTARLDTTDDVRKMLVDVSEAHNNFTPARRGEVSHQETRRLADSMGLTEEQLLSRRQGQAVSAHEALAARQMMVESGERLVQLAKAAKGGSDEQVFEFQRELSRHAAIQEQVAGITAEAGRALNSFNILAQSAGVQRARALRDLIANSGGRDTVENMADIVSRMETPEQIAEFSRKAFDPTTRDKILEGWYNFLLSGPQTHARNILGNTTMALWTIPENLLAAGLGKFRTGTDKVFVRDALARGYGYLAGTKDGLKAATKAFVTGEPSDIFLKTEAKPNAIGGLLGKAINIPTRLLQTEDELFRTMGKRMELQQLAMRSGLQKGLKGRELADHINDIIRNPPDEIVSRVDDAGRYLTFTNPVGPIANALMAATRRHPTLRFIVPFIRTPTNLLKAAVERSPMAPFTERYREAIKQGGAAADVARARLALGSGVGALFTSMALDGQVTGRGPSEPAARAIWMEENQPYSIKIGDQWVFYGGIEPLGMVAGISADLADVIKELGSDDPEVIEVVNLLSASITQNLTSKTWLKGISDALEAIDNPDRFGERWIQSFAGTVVPAAVAQVERVQDPMLREARSILDGIMARIPGLSSDLPPRRNIFGEAIYLEGSLGPDWVSPLWTKTPKNNPVAQELIRLEASISMPEREIRGAELTPQQYDEFAELSGRIATNAARSVISTPFYRNLNQAVGDKVADIQRLEMLKKIFSTARTTASGVIAAKHNLGPAIVEAKTEGLL